MAPKTKKGAKGGSKDAVLKEKIRKKRSSVPVQYSAQTIAEFIAMQVGVKNSIKFSFPSELVPKIIEKMALNLDCVECNGACQPESHVFPTVEPTSPTPPDDEDVEEEEEDVEEEEEVIDDDSGEPSDDGSLGAADSPERSVINNLSNMDNPLDIQVPGGTGSTSLTEHVLTSNPASGSRKVRSPPPARQSNSKDSEKAGHSEVSSSSEEDDEAALTAKVKAIEVRQAKELAEAKKLALEKSKSAEKAKADRRKRKEDCVKARATKEKQIIDEMERKHKKAMASVRKLASVDDDVFHDSSRPPSRIVLGVDKPAKPSRISRNSSDSDSRSQNKSHVSFESPRRSSRTSHVLLNLHNGLQEAHPSTRTGSFTRHIAVCLVLTVFLVPMST